MKVRMKSLFVALIASGIAGCITGGPDAVDRQQRAPMDMARMCDVHELMMAGSSPEEQQTMLEQHLKAMHGSVDAEMVVRHRQEMAQKCPPGGPTRK